MQFQTKILFLSLIVSVILTACTSEKSYTLTGVYAITADGFDASLKVLAGDDFLGRGPFTEGETKTVNYLAETFRNLGLEPGNGNSYFQDVPMVKITSTVPNEITLSNNENSLKLTYRKDFVAFSQWLQPEILLESSELVFAGYGIVAPEYGWNDYKGLELTGKTVMVLVNDPGFTSGNSELFKGEAMTYYGRWTYKYEEAARQGAAGVLVIHDTKPAGYPWEVVKNSWSGTGLYLKSNDGNQSRCKLEGWITKSKAEEIFDLSNTDFTGYFENAGRKEFKSMPTGIALSMSITNDWHEDVSKNVIAMAPGSTNSDEYIIYSAHWDHFGVGIPDAEGDSIYNGASDNATGTAALIELAKAFTSLETQQKRSILFLAVTAEEQGLLGSAWYVQNPIYLPEKTVANINIDALSYYGALNDLTIIGYGQSELDDYAEAAAKQQDRYIVPDQNAGKGYFFRSDHFNFAKVGIPALYASGSYDLREGGIEKMKEMNEDYEMNHYHLPADEYDPATWNLDGIVEDTQLLFEIGLKLSNNGDWPKWKEGSEFKAIREPEMQ